MRNVLTRIRYFFISLVWIITSPIWIPLLIGILWVCLPKDFWKKYDEYRNAEDEMMGF